MYNDYPTAYETTINNNYIYLIILGIFVLALLIISFLSLAKIFKKANRSGISAFIPIYNLITLLEITNSSKLYLLFLLIPGVNIVINLLVMFSLAKFFKKSKTFGFGLAFLPFIFYPILAFGNSEYIGINLTAMEGKSVVVDIPKVVDPEEMNPVVHEEKDTSLKNINISIGGGVYQKDYTNTLLGVDQNQTIFNKSNEPVLDSQLNNNIDTSNNSFITQMVANEVKMPMEEPKTMSIDFPSPINNVVEMKKEEPKEMVSQNLDIFASSNSNVSSTNQINSNLQSMDMSQINNVEAQSSQLISPIVQPTINNYGSQSSEFIACPKCGAKIKSDTKVCFLCGRRFD